MRVWFKKKIMRISLLLLALWTAAPSVWGQSDTSALALGEWRSHLPYKFGVSVTQSADFIFYATPWSILRLDKEDGSERRISKVEGLSRAGMERVEWHAGAETLIAVYDNSLIDLISDAGVFALADIRNFNGILAEKRVHDVYINGEQTALLVGNFGLTELDLEQRLFNFSTFTGNEVLGVEIFQNQLYLATDEGMYRSPVDNPFLEDFTTWEFFDAAGAFPSDFTVRAVAVWRDALYFETGGVLYKWSGTELTTILDLGNRFAAYLTAEGARLILGLACETYDDDCDSDAYFFSDDNDFTIAGGGCVSRPLDALEDERGDVWFADQFQTFRTSRTDGERCEQRTFDSPPSHEVSEILLEGDRVYVATNGPTSQTFFYRFFDDGLAVQTDNSWTIYNSRTTEQLRPPTGRIRDIFALAYDPANDLLFGGSLLEGFFEFDGENFTLYNETNTPLRAPLNDSGRIRIGDLLFDAATGNLWVTNYLAEVPLHVRLADGSWQSFAPPDGETQLTNLALDPNGYVWITTVESGIYVFDPGELTTPNDERWRNITQSGNGEEQAGLPSNRIFSIATDRDGGVWVGTELGVAVFECGGSAFDAAICPGIKPTFEQDGILGFLLETTSVRDIEIDGGNRKWFGTDAGIFVQSPNGREQIAHFNEENSPLFDNVIRDLAIQPTTGEVYVGTNRGLQSFLGDAVQGQLFNSERVTVYPNPVRPEYDGPIAIRGVAQDANVKITDVTGQLVFEGEALGGQAIWDGRDYTGRRVNTGVYLIYATNTNRRDRAEAVVGRVLVVN